MVCAKWFLAIAFSFFLSGCFTPARKRADFESGYRLGVGENMQDFMQSFYGNDFPYFYWSSPLVQEIRIPGQIKDGLFVPEHIMPVVIHPADWRKEFGYPIKRPLSEAGPDKRGGEDYALYYLDVGVRDITVLPQSFTGLEPGGEILDIRGGAGPD